MAAPMRDSPLDGGHRAKVADPRTAAAAKAEPAASNFEYDDNEWDIGIGDLIIDLDADIEKTNEKIGGVGTGGTTANNNNTTGMSSATSGAGSKTGKMAVEHSATVDKGLKMKIKRTKPGTKTSEAKHEIVKPGEQNGGEAGAGDGSKGKHPPPSSVSGSGLSGGSGGSASNSSNGSSSGNSSAGSGTSNSGSGSGNSGSNGGASNSSTSGSKRGSSGHRRDKARDKHGGTDKTVTKPTPSPAPSQTVAATPDVNGVVRPPVSTTVASSVSQTVQQQQQQQQPQQSPQQSPAPPQAPPPPPQQQRVVFPVSSGPGPPAPIAPNAPGPPSVAATAPAAAAAVTTKPEPPKVVASATTAVGPVEENRSTSPPPPKKMKTSTEPKDMLDVCVGTSVGTITEPDCLGPCEPGTSVTLEGIVWHETEGGVLVVNVTWRGKTYVGTLLDCTRHDWAPPSERHRTGDVWKASA